MEEIEVLEKYPDGWFDARSLAELVGKGRGTVTGKMKKIMENKVMCEMYRIKRRKVRSLLGGYKFEWSKNGKLKD